MRARRRDVCMWIVLTEYNAFWCGRRVAEGVPTGCGNARLWGVMIRVERLTKRFWTERGEIVAVDGVSFSVHAGEAYGLLGPNGAGKTTTLRMILGLLEADDGFAEVVGYRTSDQPLEVKRRIGFVSASSGTYPWLTPREVLWYFADLYDVPGAVARRRVSELIELFRLESFVHQRCATLSTGQRQRVNLARALVHDPPVMLLDEPTTGLDVLGSQVIYDYVRHVCTAGKAVILTTHRLDEAERLCTRFGLLHQGRLVQQGTLSELQSATGCTRLVDMFLKLAEVPAGFSFGD
ncbi:MAG: sodium ABC transporter ATP-binding protein [Pirellulaceae bacterium]|nr:MAG: sodium ABC transporter ATP-binding protein [Pirellulaceae bacterium]